LGIWNLWRDPASFLIQALLSLPAILIALSFHEWAHAFAAYKLGDPTARNLGRMTVNPLKHIDLIGFILLIIARFGWAKPVPINPRNFSHPKRDMIIVSLAGIITNFILALIALLVVFVLELVGMENSIVSSILSNVFFLNLSLMVFNIIPIPPLDGYRVLETLLIRHVGAKPFFYLQRYGSIVLLVLLITGVLSGVLSTVVSAIANGLISVYAALFGLFL
jgi:Zn-dependent protease